MKNIVLLGSTGSIGIQTLEVAAAFPDSVRVVGLGARQNIALLRKQIEQFQPRLVAVSDRTKASELRAEVGKGVNVVAGPEGILQCATMPEADCIVSAMVGAVGLHPTIAAIRAGVAVALANKEVLVCAGELVMQEASTRNVAILPIDSEHNALHQCLRAGMQEEVERLILTASGGPFRTLPVEKMESVTPEDALRHPRWDMGPKVTIDSATMMNKALEMIEARWLFNIPPSAIDLLIHPESIVHSMVEFRDGSTIAQLSSTDMRIPIQYALLYPVREKTPRPSLDLGRIGALHFSPAEPERFPAIALGRRALETGGTLPAVMNAANEIAVRRFLSRAIPFTAITTVVDRVMRQHSPRAKPSLRDIMDADSWAREKARTFT